MSNSVPDRWLDYKPFGDVIKGTKILPFKVPLKEPIVRNLESGKRFTPRILLQEFPNLKCIIDLTNTYRYYNRKDFTDAGVKYQKITIPGKNVPSMDLIEKFFKVMDDFSSTCGEGELIGVHCTHGINRTGYLICRYLVQQLGWEPQDSLKAFGEARGYPIERDNYITSLKTIQRGKKIDTSKVVLESEISNGPVNDKVYLKQWLGQMGPPGYTMPRRGFANGGPYSVRRCSFGGPPGFRPMPPPNMPPPIPPPIGPPIGPPMGPPMYGPRPFRYGPPMRPGIPTPPGPGFPHPSFPSRMPGPSRMTGPPRLPVGPAARLPPPNVPLPPPPPPPSSLSSRTFNKQLQTQKKKHPTRSEIRLRRNESIGRIVPKILKEQDFTADTFEENLLTTSRKILQRPIKKPYSQNK